MGADTGLCPGVTAGVTAARQMIRLAPGMYAIPGTLRDLDLRGAGRRETVINGDLGVGAGASLSELAVQGFLNIYGGSQIVITGVRVGNGVYVSNAHPVLTDCLILGVRCVRSNRIRSRARELRRLAKR